jgi:hypothetical protein
MGVDMTRDIAKRSAANRKAWRTRKRMTLARQREFWDDQFQRVADRAKRSVQARQAEAGRSAPATEPASHNVWPAYMTRALPNPWNKALPPW